MSVEIPANSAMGDLPRFGGAKLSDRVAAELELRIVAGEPPPGARLPTEADLCKLFGVSRSVVRDALRTLVARGLVRVGPGQGIVVTSPGGEAFGRALLLLLARSGLTMREVTDARAAIETQLGPLAVERGSEEDWERMESHLALFADAVELGDWERAHHEHSEFHLALLRAVHLPALEILLAPLQEIILVSSVPPVHNSDFWDVEAHRPVLRALRARDVERVRSALADHFGRFLADERYAFFEEQPFREAAFDALENLRRTAERASVSS